ARGVLEQAAKNLAGGSWTKEQAASVYLALARFHSDQGRPADGRKHVREYLRLIEQAGASSPGYGQEQTLRRKGQPLLAAAEFARAGHLADALDAFAKFADLSWPSSLRSETYWEQVRLSRVLGAALARQLAARPARERYQMLKTWTLPP